MAIDRTLVSPERIEKWPTACPDVLTPSGRNRFRSYQQAVDLYSKGVRLVSIEKETGVSRSQLYRLIRRAISIHPDGRLFGFRAFLPYARIKPHKRESPIKRPTGNIGAGASGAMGQLLANYPELEEFLSHEVAKKRLVYSTRPNGKLILRGLRDIHRAFLDKCHALGLRESDYPLNREQKGIRSLSSHLKKLAAPDFHSAAKAAGAPHDKGRRRDEGYGALPAVTRPYQAIEFDGHRLDIRLSITSYDPFGYEQTLELNRIWILVIVDIFTRAILGYHLTLAAEYDRFDVIRTIQNALEPHHPVSFTIPGLGYGHSGGFPSQRLPELAYAVWDEFRFDNAKAHLADDTLQKLRDELGCIAHAGPVRDPDKRPIIERFFKTLAETMSHRLPPTTLSKPDELRRLLNASNQQFSFPILLPELEELVEAVLASQNAAPHESLGGRSPLQALDYWVRGKSASIRRIPESMHGNLCLLQSTHSSKVAGSVAHGIRPYISFFGARYSSSLLCERVDLIGKQVLVYYHPDDIRSIRIFEKNGGGIGLVSAAKPWDKVPHSLRTRRQIIKLVRDKKLDFHTTNDPVYVYLQYLRRQAPRKRKATNEFESVRRSATGAGGTAPSPPGPLYPPTLDKPFDGHKPPAPIIDDATPAKPRRLSIPSGFSR